MPTHAVLASSSKKKKPYFLFPSRWFTYFKLSPPPKPPLVAERLHQKALEPAPAAVVSPGTRGAPDTSSRAERRARTPGPASEGERPTGGDGVCTRKPSPPDSRGPGGSPGHTVTQTAGGAQPGLHAPPETPPRGRKARAGSGRRGARAGRPAAQGRPSWQRPRPPRIRASGSRGRTRRARKGKRTGDPKPGRRAGAAGQRPGFAGQRPGFAGRAHRPRAPPSRRSPAPRAAP